MKRHSTHLSKAVPVTVYRIMRFSLKKNSKLQTNTVEPLLSGHSWGGNNWPLNRGSPKNNIRHGPVFSLFNKYKQMQVEKKENNDVHNNT